MDWLRLEDLPYLGACIKEAIRLSYGVTSRNPRISPDKPMKYKAWEIPPGTPVSMTVVDVHHDETIYPDSYSFIPERWLNSPKTQNGSSLDRYFVAFGKGARSCLGIKYVFSATFIIFQSHTYSNLSLAHAELYLALATVFRRFHLELYDTDVSDVKLAHDFFLPSPKLDTKGVRVKVKSIIS
jgi:Cytochrome P450